MKIVFASDWHIWENLYLSCPHYRHCLEQVTWLNPDVFVWGGDMIPFYRDARKVFEIYREVMGDLKTFFIIGNHEFWNEPSGRLHRPEEMGTMYKVYRDECRRFGIKFLESKPQMVGQILCCGTTAWYDYQAANMNTTTIEYLSVNKRLYNNDANFILSPVPDVDYAYHCQRKLLRQITTYTKQLNPKDVFVFTHMPVLEETKIPAPHGYNQIQWEISNAYFFNLSLGRKLRKNPKIGMIISGHIHRYLSGMADNCIYATCGSDYYKPEALEISTDDYTVKRIQLVGCS